MRQVPAGQRPRLQTSRPPTSGARLSGGCSHAPLQTLRCFTASLRLGASLKRRASSLLDCHQRTAIKL